MVLRISASNRPGLAVLRFSEGQGTWGEKRWTGGDALARCDDIRVIARWVDGEVWPATANAGGLRGDLRGVLTLLVWVAWIGS